MDFHPPSALAPGNSWVQVNLNTLADGFVGAGTCVGPTGSLLVGTVNELSTGGAGDTFMVYEGTNP